MASRIERFALPLQVLLGAGSLVTALIALWLLTVVVWVLPARDPAHVPLWTAIAIALGVYAATSAAFVVRGPRPRMLRPATIVLSLAAVGFGMVAMGSMLRAARTGGHFEGYLLLMGASLAAQGLCALAYAGFTIALARSVRAV